jgi:3'-phosphoadenosine 5'-phosphosulfate (PAPS) 3'-phosphatase
VTLADFAVQALIVDALSKAFPNDKFIAEEDSSLLRSNAAIREKLLQILSAASDELWTCERLYETLDRGNYFNNPFPFNGIESVH